MCVIGFTSQRFLKNNLWKLNDRTGDDAEIDFMGVGGKSY